MDLASVVAAPASIGVRVSGSTPNNNIQGDSSRACPTGLAGPESSGTLNYPGQHFQPDTRRLSHRWQATPPGAGQGDSVGPPHPHTCAHSTWVLDPNSPPNGRAVGGGTAPVLRRPSHNGGRHPPRGRPSATSTASNAGPQGRRLWSRCLVPTPAPTAPGTHGWRNTGYPLQRTGGWGRDSA